MKVRNNVVPYCYLTISILMVSIAQIFLAKGMQNSSIQTSIDKLYIIQVFDVYAIASMLLDLLKQHKYIIIGMLCYIASFLIWGKTLTYFALSKAYSFLSLSYIIVYAFSFYFLPTTDNQFKLSHFFGIALIILGVVAVMYKGKLHDAK
ncbi:hypothetical protein [Thorsellia anophelis]|uniref:4-amino-4-deoxy-L-arabinose-phosphoundecaprenol flippase subunit ArnF n=1 Tax=Thorsellia anophelis DSM 18579 TaxID=1123402 RepID=A0A1I0BPX6_9GAMM|nr:hypothetical protein [Thorsellia anophelis]SET08680.1 hypothetical protein SAMN02583745_01344 [Thorsellia anophelis DSM 18579]